MSKKMKIYLKTGTGFFALFIASVVIITLLQADINLRDMGRTLTSTAELGKNIINDVEYYNENENDYTAEQLMSSINLYITGFVSEMWNNHCIYTSVLLLDSDRQIVSRSGFILQYDPKSNESENNRMMSIPLEKYCSDEQMEQLYNTVRYDIRGKVAIVSGEISGFIDNLEQWIPQKLTLYSQYNESKILMLEFNVETEHDYKQASQTFQNAMLYIPGPGTNQNTPTKTDRKILKECDELAVRQIDTAQENLLGASGMSKAYYMTFDGVGTITINGETYYFAIGGQGFPLRSAISELMHLYTFLLIVMLILFSIVSHGFIKQYQRQLELETDRRKLTMKAAAELKNPLNMINDCGTKLRQLVSEDKRNELLDTIINTTEQMDDTVRELLISAQDKKGIKHEKS